MNLDATLLLDSQIFNRLYPDGIIIPNVARGTRFNDDMRKKGLKIHNEAMYGISKLKNNIMSICISGDDKYKNIDAFKLKNKWMKIDNSENIVVDKLDVDNYENNTSVIYSGMRNYNHMRNRQLMIPNIEIRIVLYYKKKKKMHILGYFKCIKHHD